MEAPQRQSLVKGSAITNVPSSQTPVSSDTTRPFCKNLARREKTHRACCSTVINEITTVLMNRPLALQWRHQPRKSNIPQQHRPPQWPSRSCEHPNPRHLSSRNYFDQLLRCCPQDTLSTFRNVTINGFWKRSLSLAICALQLLPEDEDVGVKLRKVWSCLVILGPLGDGLCVGVCSKLQQGIANSQWN